MKFLLLILFTMPFQCMAEPYYIELATNIRSDHIKEMKKQSFEVTMAGGGFFYDVEAIDLGFHLVASPSIREARTLYVKGVQELLTLINNNSLIQPYLHNKPFTINNLTYYISFNEIPHHGTDPEPVAFVFYAKGDIVYCAYDPNCGDATQLRTIHEEPFEEAVRIVSEQPPESNSVSSLAKPIGWWNYFRSFFSKAS